MAFDSKETFKLLDVSTDPESDELRIETPRKKRALRTRRARRGSRSDDAGRKPWRRRAPIIVTTVALSLWLAVLSWAAATLAADTRRLDASLKAMSMGSQGVGDALQRCHSTTKELQYNHTEMAAKLDGLILRTDNLTAQVAALQASLANVKQQVASAPELVNVPEQLSTLGSNVARFGSQIKDFDSTVATLRQQSTALSDGQNLLAKNLTLLKNQIDVMWNRSFDSSDVDKSKLVPLMKLQSDLQNTLTQLSTNVSSINETLGTRIDWTTQDNKNDHRKVVELEDVVQKNSVTLSSLETAWKQSNNILSHNITNLDRDITDKVTEVQRQLADLKNLVNQLEKKEANTVKDINMVKDSISNSVAVDVAANKDDISPDILAKPLVRKPEPAYEQPKITPSSTILSVSPTTGTMPVVEGKPSILSSGSA